MNTVETHLRELSEHGVTIIKQAISTDTCDKIISDFHNAVSHIPENDRIRTENGNFARLYNLHLQSRTLEDLLFDGRLMAILDRHFEKRTALNSTIFFHEGSQQCMHRDTPYFWSEPNGGKFVGVWFALEDANERNGKLEYITGGHKVQVDPVSFAANRPDVSSRDLFGAFGEHIDTVCTEKGMRVVSPNISKGDVVIWHADLPHGGSKIEEAGATRYSVVAHYLPEGSYVTEIDYFWGRRGLSKIMEFVDVTSKSRKMRHMPSVSFATNDPCLSERRLRSS